MRAEMRAELETAAAALTRTRPRSWALYDKTTEEVDRPRPSGLGETS